MSAKRVIATFALAVLGTPAFADMPDGHGGRTSPQASPRHLASPPHSCCPRGAAEPARRAASPAEVKAIGELAWAARAKANDGVGAGCDKKVPVYTAVYASSAELKALGHLSRNRNTTATTISGTQCCDSQACPMRRAS